MHESLLRCRVLHRVFMCTADEQIVYVPLLSKKYYELFSHIPGIYLMVLW